MVEIAGAELVPKRTKTKSNKKEGVSLVKKVKKIIKPKKLKVFNPHKYPIIGNIYSFGDGIELESTPKNKPRDKFVLRKFSQGKYDGIHSKYFIFVGKDTNGLECYIYYPRPKKNKH